MRFPQLATVALASLCLFSSCSKGEEWTLQIADRSMFPRDGLYHCVLTIPNDSPVEDVSLKLVDRQEKIVGEMPLALHRFQPTEREVRFTLSQEYIKKSKLLISRKDSESFIADAVLVLGDYPARKREGDRFVEVKID